ncbi:MAG: response regulator [bacterium]|nr:response regulator [bacterium]
MRVLIAEDDTFFQKFYSTELVDLGYEVEIASNGVEALEKMRAKKPDVLILDIIMPEKDGFEVLEEMSQDTGLKSVPTLVFSTLGQEQDMKRATDLGAKHFINKSFFDFDILVQKIKEITQP